MSRKRYPKPARFRIALIAGQAAIGCVFAQTQGNDLAWQLTVVDGTGGRHPSLTYQPAARPPFLFSTRGPYIAYFKDGLRLAQLNGTIWNFTTIDSTRAIR